MTSARTHADSTAAESTKRRWPREVGLGAPRRAENVTYDIVDGRAVIVDPQGWELVTLNPVGTLV
jgi:hypothetical protein